MSIAYVFTLDGLAFSSSAKHARGPITYHQDQRWSEFEPLGITSTGATILTFLGLSSQKWQLVARCSTTEKDKLLTVFNARTAVIWKTPQDSTGVSVMMTEFDIPYEDPIEASKFLCRFTLVRR